MRQLLRKKRRYARRPDSAKKLIVKKSLKGSPCLKIGFFEPKKAQIKKKYVFPC
jgi:hypothetical protein